MTQGNLGTEADRSGQKPWSGRKGRQERSDTVACASCSKGYVAVKSQMTSILQLVSSGVNCTSEKLTLETNAQSFAVCHGVGGAGECVEHFAREQTEAEGSCTRERKAAGDRGSAAGPELEG